VGGQFHALAALPEERASNTHQIRGWVGPRAGLNMVTKKSFPYPCWELNSSHPGNVD